MSELPKKQALLCPQAQAGGALRAVEGGGGATGRGFAEVANAVFELPEHRTSSDVAGAGTAQRVARNAPKPFGMAAKIKFRVLTVSTRQTPCNLPKTNMEQKPNCTGIYRKRTAIYRSLRVEKEVCAGDGGRGSHGDRGARGSA